MLFRRFSFGYLVDSLQTGDMFYGLLSAYVRICSFLLLADVHLISRPRPDDVYILPLLSHKHLRNLLTILRPDKTPAFHMVSKEYSVDVRKMVHRLQKDFLAADGAWSLLRLADKAVHHVPVNTQNHIALFASPLLHSLGMVIFQDPNPDSGSDRPGYSRGVLQFLEKYMDDLFNLNRTTDSNVARDLIQHFHTLLCELCVWDKKIEADLIDRFLDFRSTESPTTSSSADALDRDNQQNYRTDPESFPALVAHAWKFKLLRKYLTKGKMDLRVMSIAVMDAGLVDIWKHYSDRDPTCKHPVMQYLADFLLDGKVVDYIVSVDSHPQLIARSGNIVGFLVVTHRWSDSQADAIWNTVATNPDPRVVAATMTMLRGIVNLMRPADCLHLCSKLYELPIECYTMEILRFLRELSSKLADRASFADYAARDRTARPWNVCIRMIRDTMSQRDTKKEMVDLHEEAIDHLRTLAVHVPVGDRHAIYHDCAEHISSHSMKATGSVKAIYILAAPLHSGDGLFFQQNQDLTRQILEEISWLSKTEKNFGSNTYQVCAFRYRLELLALLICRAGPAIPNELYPTLWDHTVGLHAISDNARDYAWAQLLHTVKYAPDNDYCRQLVSSYLSQMAPCLYTAGMFEFVAIYSFPVTRQLVATDQGHKSVLQIPGADVLWSMILSSPEGTIEDRAARLLATRYVQVNETEGVLLADVEAAHVALVEKCMDEIRSACMIVRRHLLIGSGSATADTAVSEILLQENESRCRRILLFQKLLLEKIRQKPEFNRGRRADSKVDDTDVPRGDDIAVRYQCGDDRKVVMMAADHTVDDLYRRLCHATGYTKIQLFAKGQRFNATDQASRKISDIDFGGQLLVLKTLDAEVTRPLSGLVAYSSVFESTVVNHFNELFLLMDSDDTISQLVGPYSCAS
jgi:ubiquitin carboxyl-terminal hydrolase 34